jgi:hypothetical protein
MKELKDMEFGDGMGRYTNFFEYESHIGKVLDENDDVDGYSKMDIRAATSWAKAHKITRIAFRLYAIAFFFGLITVIASAGLILDTVPWHKWFWFAVLQIQGIMAIYYGFRNSKSYGDLKREYQDKASNL